MFLKISYSNNKKQKQISMKLQKIYHKKQLKRLLNIIIKNLAGKFCNLFSSIHPREKKNSKLKRNVIDFIIKIS